jgi:hypothetical protein
MGCDIYYSCKTSDRERVTKLVNILCKWAQQVGSSYKIVNLPDKQLFFKDCGEPIDVDLYGFAFTDLWHEPVEESPEMHSRCQFIFDFLRGGKLIKLVLPSPSLYQATEKKINCLLMEDGGYWRSVKDYDVLPRFLAFCKLRYLPDLEYWSDYGEADYYIRNICTDGEITKELAGMTESAFYSRVISKLGILG